MIQKNYLPLDNEYNVLALLRKGYSFIEVGNMITYRKSAGGDGLEEVVFTEAIPQIEPLDNKQYVLLSQFLKGAPQMALQVESSYF